MHISLDAALQRQPLLSTVGDKLLPSFPGAAAAYSLRALNGDANNVVNVRRDGDDGERDFTAEGVALELENWVNGKLETTLPADVATAAAAYSLRKVRNEYSENAVQIRRTSDDVEVNVAFDSNGEVSTSSAITNVGSQFPTSVAVNRTTATAYDTFSTDGLFAFSASDAGIAQCGYEIGDGKAGDTVTVTFDLTINSGGLEFIALRPTMDAGGNQSNDTGFITTSGTKTFTFTATGDYGVLAFVSQSTGVDFSVSNVSIDVQPDAGDTTATTLGEFLTEATPARNRTGSSRYDTFIPDGVTGFTAITNNIAAGGFDIAGASGTEVQVSFDITVNSGSVNVKLRPDFETGSDVSNNETITTSGSKSFTLTATDDFKAMLFITASADYVISNFSVNVPYNHDATVVTWYDQSGNGNHAEQPATNLQPKIVSAGSYLGHLDWNGGSQLRTDSGFDVTYGSGETDFSAFWVSTPEGTSVDAPLIATTNGFIVKWENDIRGGFSILDASNPTAGVSSSELGSAFVLSDDTRQGFVNGSISIDSTGTSTYRINEIYLGFRGATGYGRTYKMKEVIIYNSDQSDNRFKIESNINNYYGIYTAAEDGFVEAWYDQSGNDNHAVQDAVEGYQPKIVSAGSYLGEVDFDGSNDFFQLPFSLGSNSGFLFLSVLTPDAIQVGSFIEFRDVNDDGARNLLLNNGNVFTSTDQADASQLYTTSEFLLTGEYDGVNVTSYVDGSGGTPVAGVNVVNTTNGRIGVAFDGSLPFDGKTKEIIIYDSDQSTNRTAIESNIADEYGITLS